MKLITIQTPVWEDAGDGVRRVLVGYRETTDLSDCVRCTGAY